jgi:hypothetical protein
MYPDARADEAEAARWAGDWARVWGSPCVPKR